MRLHPASREFYTLRITTDPPVDTVHASFDDGATWTPGDLADGEWRWLVRGPDADSDPAAPATLITGSTTVLLRIPAVPELIVRPVVENPILVSP